MHACHELERITSVDKGVILPNSLLQIDVSSSIDYVSAFMTFSPAALLWVFAIGRFSKERGI
jgi:hypothetical protein